MFKIACRSKRSQNAGFNRGPNASTSDMISRGVRKYKRVSVATADREARRRASPGREDSWLHSWLHPLTASPSESSSSRWLGVLLTLELIPRLLSFQHFTAPNKSAVFCKPPDVFARRSTPEGGRIDCVGIR